MTSRSVLPRRALGAVCLAAVLAVPAACGGGGDDDAAADPAPTTTTTVAAALASCSQRFLEVTARPDVVEAARSDAEELPAEAEAALEVLDADCGDELDAMPAADAEALVAQVDPEVAAYLGEPSDVEFEKTGESISGMDG